MKPGKREPAGTVEWVEGALGVIVIHENRPGGLVHGLVLRTHTQGWTALDVVTDI